jgi:uncharacterized DUF497 family protein
MKIFNWKEEKNNKIKKERGISFEEIVFAILNDQLLDILEHPNKELYGDQKLYVVALNGYAYIVPFIEKEEEIFLKTIFPSRKYTRMYFGEEDK